MIVRNLSFKHVKFKCCYSQSTDDAKKIVRYLLGATGVIGLDFETAKGKGYEEYVSPKGPTGKNVGPQPGLCPHFTSIRLVQFFDGDKAFVFDAWKTGLEVFRPLFETKCFVAHNGLFEIKHLQHNGFLDINIDCSMLVAILVDRAENSPFDDDSNRKDFTEDETQKEDDNKGPSTYNYRKGYGLDAVIKTLFNVTVSKQFQTSNWNADILTSDQINYAALDGFLTYAVYKKLWVQIEKYKLVTAYKVLKKMQHVVADMELNGLGFDVEKHQTLINEWGIEHERASKQCRRFFKRRSTRDERGNDLAGSGEEINLNSTKQLGSWLEERYKEDPEKLEQWPKTNTGRYSFRRDQLHAYKEDEAIKCYIEYKKYSKLLSTYGKNLVKQLHPITGRIHTSFGIGKTRTGRLSSFNPNLQNLPRESTVREIFKADNGKCLVVADFSQIEIRVAAELSRDPVMLKAYEQGIDLHRLIVHKLTGKNIDAITKEERQLGKGLNFGLAFGMWWKKLKLYLLASYDLPISDSKAEKMYYAYHKLYRVYSTWCERQRDKAAILGFARTPLGRQRKLADGEIYTKSVNTPVQGGAAEVLMCSMIDLRNQIKQQGLRDKIKIISTVHDEIILECDKSSKDIASKLLQSAMENGMHLIFPKSCLKDITEVHTGNNWNEGKG